MSTPAVRIDVRPDAVAVLTIDQPDAKVNVLAPALVAELEAAVDSLAARTDLKGLVVASGKPGVFIAGADIKIFANAPGPNDPAVRAYIENGLWVLEKLESLPYPTCAAIDGAALGGGLELALACDYRNFGTNPKVQLGLPEVTLGLVPGWGGTQRLPRKTEWDVAAHMLLTGRPLDRHLAIIAGLGTGVDSEVLIDGAAQELTESVAEWFIDERARRLEPVTRPDRTCTPDPPDTAAGRELTHLLEVVQSTTQAEGIKLETEAFLRLAGSDESKRLIAAFFASRKR